MNKSETVLVDGDDLVKGTISPGEVEWTALRSGLHGTF